MFRIQIVDIKGLDTTGLGDIHELLPIKCHIYIDSKGAKNRFSRYTCALSDVNNLVWHNEFCFFDGGLVSKIAGIDVLGTQHGKSYILATNYRGASNRKVFKAQQIRTYSNGVLWFLKCKLRLGYLVD